MSINPYIFGFLCMLSGVGVMTVLAFAGLLPNLVFG